MPLKIQTENFFTGFKANPHLENFTDILKGKEFRLEKIVSKGYKTPKTKWLSEPVDEFVMLLKGKAELLFETGQTVELKEGDYLVIPADTKHKVIKTSIKPLCYWLTIHFKK